MTDAYYNRGLAHEEKGNWKSAIKNYRITIQLLENERNALKIAIQRPSTIRFR
jgi:hypothetical protein